MEKNEARAVYPWVGNLERTVLDVSRSCLAQTAAERNDSGPAEYWRIRQRHED
jgi:hypothetical protein